MFCHEKSHPYRLKMTTSNTKDKRVPKYILLSKKKI